MMQVQQQVSSFNQNARRKLLLTEIKLPDFKAINAKSMEREMLTDDRSLTAGQAAGIMGVAAGAGMALSGKKKEKQEIMNLEREKRDSELSHFMFTQNRDKELNKMETRVSNLFIFLIKISHIIHQKNPYKLF